MFSAKYSSYIEITEYKYSTLTKTENIIPEITLILRHSYNYIHFAHKFITIFNLNKISIIYNEN